MVMVMVVVGDVDLSLSLMFWLIGTHRITSRPPTPPSYAIVSLNSTRSRGDEGVLYTRIWLDRQPWPGGSVRDAPCSQPPSQSRTRRHRRMAVVGTAIVEMPNEARG